MANQSFSDQMGHTLSLGKSPPQRIISLVPSQTELLASLGLDQEVIGITKFCIHPPHWLKQKKIVGGTKNVNTKIIASLSPDLIIGNKEENDRDAIEELRKNYPVWISDITTLPQALSMIAALGDLMNRQKEALQIVHRIDSVFKTIKKFEGQSVLYLIWKAPWMAAAKDTFIDAMLSALGLKNALQFTSRYPSLTSDEIRHLNPQYIFLSSEPFPFKEKHVEELHKVVPASKIILVDGEMFSWYGSRLLHAASYFNTLALS